MCQLLCHFTDLKTANELWKIANLNQDSKPILNFTVYPANSEGNRISGQCIDMGMKLIDFVQESGLRYGGSLRLLSFTLTSWNYKEFQFSPKLFRFHYYPTVFHNHLRLIRLGAFQALQTRIITGVRSNASKDGPGSFERFYIIYIFDIIKYFL